MILYHWFPAPVGKPPVAFRVWNTTALDTQGVSHCQSALTPTLRTALGLSKLSVHVYYYKQ